MSLATWKKEFYSVKPTKKMSTIEAVKHSLQKWEGLKSKNLKKHEVKSFGRTIEDAESKELAIDTESCALCVKFKHPDNCVRCPLYRARGGVPCDSNTSDERVRAIELSRYTAHPYAMWCDYNNPLPMIRDLKKTLKMLEREALEK